MKRAAQNFLEESVALCVISCYHVPAPAEKTTARAFRCFVTNSENDMAKNSSEVQAKRNQLVAEVEAVIGVKMKRSSTATGGLSCSNESMLLNGFAHLLCNEKNFPTVRWALYNEVAIPLEFQENFNRASFLYACGTAPRIVLKGSKHVSKDAVKSGKGQEFVQWAQAERIAGVGGLAGLSASIREGIQFGQVNDFGELVGANELEDNQLKAANQQIAMRKVSESVGQSAFQKAVGKQGVSAMTRVEQLIAAMKAAHAPAPKKSAPATEVAEEAEAAATGTGGKKKRGGKKAAAATVTLID